MPSADLRRQPRVDVHDQVDHALAHVLALDLAQLEAEGEHDVLLLRLGLAVPEQRRLAEMIAEAIAALADLLRVDPLRIADEAPHVAPAWNGQPPPSELGW